MKTLQKYFAILQIAYKNHAVYFYDILGTNWIFVMRVVVIIFLFKLIYSMKWWAISGYTIEEISWALIFAQILVKSRPAINIEINEEVQSGKIATYLLTPISYIWFKFFENFSKFIYNTIIWIAFWLVIWYSFFWEISTSPSWILGWIILLIGAMFVSYFWYMMIWLTSFFVEDNEWFRFIYQKLDMLFWWNILPIPFLPLFMQQIAFISPFAYAWYTAGLIFSKFQLDKFLLYLAIQSFWAIFLILVCTWLYNKWRTKLVTNWW